MLQRSLAGLAVLLTLFACRGNPLSPPTGPMVSSVSVQPGDLPSDMNKCDQSGDIKRFLNRSQTKNPDAYTSAKTDWNSAQKQGATAAYIAFYTDSRARCANVESNTAESVVSATYKLEANYVIQFKDKANAVKGYTSGSFFGFSLLSLKNGKAKIDEGTMTGLSANSIVVNIFNSLVPNQSIYVAYWQNKAFMVILMIVNIDNASCKKVALAMNGRIK
jgi:hypothetical protein